MKLQIIGSGGMWHKENSASYLIDDHILRQLYPEP